METFKELEEYVIELYDKCFPDKSKCLKLDLLALWSCSCLILNRGVCGSKSKWYDLLILFFSILGIFSSI